MANSILNSSGPTQPVNRSPINYQMLQQLSEFKKSYKGNPKQAVMQMLQRGQITNPQLQQAMQIAKQIQTMIK